MAPPSENLGFKSVPQNENKRSRVRREGEGEEADASVAMEVARRSKKKRGGKKRTAAVAAGAHPVDADAPSPSKKKRKPLPPAEVRPQQHTQQHERLRRPAFDPADDCETPLEAYKHVAPLLAKLAQRLKKPKDQLRIWDPYYCDGAVRAHLASLGFPNVHNARGEDFYELLASGDEGRLPPHDVLVTNPPFSGDHIARLVQFLSSSRGCKTPFLILAPDYVHRKAWFAQLERRRPDIFYMLPLERYSFVAARGGRAQNTNVPCRHWAREGRCPRGEACPFLHRRRHCDGVLEKVYVIKVDDDDDDEDGDGVAGGASGIEVNGADDAMGGGEGRSGAAVAAQQSTGRPAMINGGGGGAVVVAPFDCVWHVHLGGGNDAEARRRTQSVVQAWRQKYERVGRGGFNPGVGGEAKTKSAGVGVRLVASAESLPSPPGKQNFPKKATTGR